MTKPEPTHSSNGENLDHATVEAIRQELINLRSAGVSIAKNSERLLEALGFPVESAVRLRSERRQQIRRGLTRK